MSHVEERSLSAFTAEVERRGRGDRVDYVARGVTISL